MTNNTNTQLEKDLLKENKTLKEYNEFLKGALDNVYNMLDTKQKVILNKSEQIRKLKCEISVLRLYCPSTNRSSAK